MNESICLYEQNIYAHTTCNVDYANLTKQPGN